jgi:hypothetical protein
MSENWQKDNKNQTKKSHKSIENHRKNAPFTGAFFAFNLKKSYQI